MSLCGHRARPARPHVPRQQPFQCEAQPAFSIHQAGTASRRAHLCRVQLFKKGHRAPVSRSAGKDRGHLQRDRRPLPPWTCQRSRQPIYRGALPSELSLPALRRPHQPAQDIVRIIEAFSALKAELAKEGQFEDLKLIIIGDEVSKHPDLRRAVVKGRVQNDVRFLGFVPIEVLRIFYDQAKIFVFPSLYEGFGLPPLEAMAHSTPVVTSNTSSIPEVVGNAAVMVNPENVFEIMKALHRVLLDQSVRDKLKARGVQQAGRFSWDQSVRRMLEVYREVANRN